MSFESICFLLLFGKSSTLLQNKVYFNAYIVLDFLKKYNGGLQMIIKKSAIFYAVLAAAL